jgi:membrane protease YdiL (CAAX protease family)
MDTNLAPPAAPDPDTPAGSASTEHVPPSVPASTSRRENALLEIFVGPNGLYPGTRWLIYVALGFLIALILLTAMRIVHPHSGGSVAWMMLAQVIVMLAAILPALVMARIEGHPFGDFGLPARNAFRRNFWIGAVWGIVSLTVLLLVIYFAGGFSFGSVALHGIGILKFAIFYAVFFLFTGFFEDFLFRGYSQWVLSKGMHFWPAAAFLSACFGAIHSTNAGESKAGLLAAGMIGFFFCLTLRRTGDLWWAIGFHMSWDWGESYLFSVPDSGGMMTGHLLNSSFHGPPWLTGGSVGPEGSLIVFIVIPVMWVLFDRMYPDVKYQA